MKARYTLACLPPSANRLWRYKGKGEAYRSEDYMTWLNGEGWNLKAQQPGQPKFDGPVYVVIAMKRPRANADLDNRLKPIGDLLQHIGAISNDKHIHGWNAYWSDDVPSGAAAELSIASAA
jgi:Holliday junction resolvase RusA-like endonuclease